MSQKTKLPEGWREVTLGEISIEKGQYGSGASAIEYDKQKPVYVRITDIDDDGNLKELDQRSPSEIEEKYNLNFGDFLFARSGSVGRTYLHLKKDGKYQYAGYLIRFKLNQKLILPKYLYYVTKSNYYWGWIEKTQKSVTISNINAQQYASFNFILPPLPTQQKIVSILEKAEQAKQWRKEADNLTKEYLKSVFLEMFGDTTKFPRVQIRQIVKEIETINPERDYGSRTFQYVDIASVDSSIGNIVGSSAIVGKEAPSRARQRIRYEDIIISTVRPNLNAVALVPHQLGNQICSTGFCVLRADQEKILPEYLYQITRSGQFIDSMVKIAKGASYPAVSNRDILNHEISLPMIKDQKKFVSVVKQVGAMKERQNQSKENLSYLFNVLMQKAFRGELEV